ncbi:MAG: hypothetical protein KZQ83_12910 [gamma proteobacterium symbiont of Taylorina sp.]|nr:hypothetical protein [gamma proteobacterium symbiont of Taylorina sp.]
MSAAVAGQVTGSYRQASESEFLAADDLPVDRDICLTIAGASIEKVTSPNNRVKDMVCLSFEKTPKKLALNRTNGRSIAKITRSTQVEDWPGSQVCLYRTTIKAFGDPQLPAIRVRLPK